MEAKFKRNIVLVGHAHCGKTSLAESLMFVSGATLRKGDVLQGNSLSDFNDDEIERKSSINASFLKTNFNDYQVQIIDTPGYMDFIGETVSSLRASDSAVVVVDAVSGVEIGTQDAWDRLDSRGMPRIVFITKMDKEGASLNEALSSIQKELSPQAVRVDLNSAELIETVAETDDQLLEKYLEAGSLSPEEIRTALRKAVLDAKIFPVFSGSALQDQGTKELLQAIITYLPSPVEHSVFSVKDPVTQELKTIKASEEGPFAGFVFKSLFDPHLGQVSLMRILRGTLNSNGSFLNVNNSGIEHISSITMLQGKEQVAIHQASCGDIVALPKLKNTHVSDSLTDTKEKILFDPIVFPEPSISASIKPKTRADEEKISTSLNRLCEEDHTFRVNRNSETKELIVSGIGDLHLKIILERLRKRYHVDVDLGTPKVSYREAITKTARARHKYKKQSGGRGQYADVELELSPLPRDGAQYEFLNKIFGGAIPRNFVPSVEKGVKQAISEGVLAGYPVSNIQVAVVDGSYHEVDSSDMAFQIAGSLALKEAFRLAGPVLLEPIMEVNIVVPDEFIGQISGDISSRRGRIMGSEAKGKNQVIKAHIPMAEMFSYATDLRSITGGRGSYTMTFLHYEQAPAKIIERVVAEKKT
ncbi:MAG: elongation factor G [Candidatus Omnitrophota bacterium]